VLSRFLDFNSKEANGAVLVNTYDEGVVFINFARDVGKRITVKLYDGKDSVKKIVRRRGNVIY
jgi:tyrosyl-tRNA synthetase